MADNYLEKKMEEFRNKPMSSNNNKKVGTTLGKLLSRNRSYSQFDSKVIVRMEHLKSITEVCSKIEFLGDIKPEDFSFEYSTPSNNQTENAQIIVKINNQKILNEGELKEVLFNKAQYGGKINLIYINLGILLQSLLLRATEMGLNGYCQKIIEKENSPLKEIEVIITIGKGFNFSN